MKRMFLYPCHTYLLFRDSFGYHHAYGSGYNTGCSVFFGLFCISLFYTRYLCGFMSIDCLFFRHCKTEKSTEMVWCVRHFQPCNREVTFFWRQLLGLDVGKKHLHVNMNVFHMCLCEYFSFSMKVCERFICECWCLSCLCKDSLNYFLNSPS